MGMKRNKLPRTTPLLQRVYDREKWTQGEAGDKVGLHQTQVGRLLKGETKSSPEAIERWAAFMDERERRELMLAYAIDTSPRVVRDHVERLTSERDALVERVAALERRLSGDVEPADGTWDRIRAFKPDDTRELLQILALAETMDPDIAFAAMRSGLLLVRQLESQRRERGSGGGDAPVAGIG